jgi:cytochrome P450
VIPETRTIVAAAPPGSVGPSLSVWTLRRMRQDPLGFLQSLAVHGDVVPFALGSRKAFLLCQPADIHAVLIGQHTKFAKGPSYDRAKRLLGNGLFTAAGALHKRRRSLVQPAFHRASLDRYGEIMIRRAESLAKRWNDGDVIDLVDQMQNLTLGVVGEALFGADLYAAKAAAIRDALTTAIDSDDALLSLLAPIRKMRAARERLDRIVQDLIEQRLAMDDAGEDLLGILLHAHQAEAEPDPQQLHDDVLTLLLAGYDTISNALTWTWILSARHPAAEETVHAELDAVLGSRDLTPGDMPRLPYTRAVFAESLRILPPSWVLARIALADCEIGGVTIPEGALVVMSQYLVHRDPRFFERPLAFEPDRWLQTPAAPRARGTYFPFGAGPRSCIGEGFAWMQGVLILATLARHWRLRTVTAAPLAFDVRMTLRPVRPLLVQVHRRS